MSERRISQEIARASLAVLAAAGAAACSDASEESRPTPTTAPAVESTTSTTSPEQLAQALREEATAYLTSPERNFTIASVAHEYAALVVEMAEEGRLGYFDFYNFDTGEWRSENPATEGWGYLQQSSDELGEDFSVAVAVYRKADGTYDLVRGVQAIRIQFGEASAIEFESPTFAATMLGSANESLGGWITRIVGVEFTEGNVSDTRHILEVSHYSNSLVNPAEDIVDVFAANDQFAISSLRSQFDQLSSLSA